MFRKWNHQKGAVLIVCLGILAVLAILGISFSQLMIVERAAASNYSDGIRAKFAAQSGIEYATAYLRKLARVKQHSDPLGDFWFFDPFWTDEQGRPIFDINPDPTLGVTSHSPAFRLGSILDGNSSDSYSEEYTGYVHATYYEEATDTGTPGNYFQVKVQSAASQFYLNVHAAHLQGLENMLCSFIRAVVTNGRTHKIPQADGTVINGRAFFPGFPTTAGVYDTGTVRLFIRNVLLNRATLPSGLFSTKEQLLEIFQDMATSALPGGPLPFGITPEDLYNDLKNFVTCHAWVDDSVLYLNPETSPNPYPASVATHVVQYPGSTAADRDPDPVLLGTISSTGPYYTFTPSAVETYYSCRELRIGGLTGAPITGRAPIDINAASEEVLTAVFAGLTGKRPDLGAGATHFSSPTRHLIDFDKAKLIANLIVTIRSPLTSPPNYNDYFANFYTWDQFYGFLNSFADTTLSQEQSDIIKAMANPNTDINKFNPDTTLRKRVDKGDITTNTATGRASFTTELCFGSMGYYDLNSIGKVLGSGGFTPPPNSRVALTAKSEYNTIVKVYEVFRDTTQRDFETDRDSHVGRNEDTTGGVPETGPPATARPFEVVEYAVISYPEPRDNTQVNFPGAPSLVDPMRPRSVDDATNPTHAIATYSGNQVHAAEYDGQLALNGMIATQYYQSANSDATNGTGYSNAQWQPFVVTSTATPVTGPFPIPKVEYTPPEVDEFGFPLGEGTTSYTPPAIAIPAPINFSGVSQGIYDGLGFNDFVEEGFRSLLVGFNLNSWEPNVPVPDCIGAFGTTDPGRIMAASYPLSDLVSPTSSRTMREGRNLYPLGFNPRANKSNAIYSSGSYPIAYPGSSDARFQTYLRYHNANVHRFEGGVSVWVKPDHDFTLGAEHDLHRGTIAAFRNGDPNIAGTPSGPTVSYYRSDLPGPLNNATHNPGEVALNTETLSGFASDEYMSNAFIIRFDSAYSIRAGIWGSNHFEESDDYKFKFVEGTPGSGSGATTPALAQYGGLRLRSTPQVWATNSVKSNLTGTSMQTGIRSVPGKWQTVQIWYRRSPAWGTSLSPFKPLSTQTHEKFVEGNGYRFVWSLPVQKEDSNIAFPSGAGLEQPGVSSWPSGQASHPVWTGFGPFAPHTTSHPISGPNPNYRYCSTVWVDDFRDIEIEYIGFSDAGGSTFTQLFPPEDRLTSNGIFGAFMTSAASVRTDAATPGMENPLPIGAPGPIANATGPGAPIDPTVAPATFEGAWFGSAHPAWFDGRFARTAYNTSGGANDPQLLDIALGGGVGTDSLGDSNLGSDWDIPGTFSTDLGNLAYATIDNFQIHPFDFSYSPTVRDSHVGDVVTHLGEDVEDYSTTGDLFQFNDMQKRYWDAGHRFGIHAQPGHFFSGAFFDSNSNGIPDGSEKIVTHGVYKKYCRQIAQDAIRYGVITVGTVAFTTYAGTIPAEASGWADMVHPTPFLGRKNMTYTSTSIERLEYVSYLGSSGDVEGVSGVVSIPYNVSVRAWKDAPAAGVEAPSCCDFEFPTSSTTGTAIKADDGGSGGATNTFESFLSGTPNPTMWTVTLTRSEVESGGLYISYSAGLSSDTVHAVANESPYLDDVTITYLLPNSVILQYREVID